MEEAFLNQGINTSLEIELKKLVNYPTCQNNKVPIWRPYQRGWSLSNGDRYRDRDIKFR